MSTGTYIIPGSYIYKNIARSYGYGHWLLSIGLIFIHADCQALVNNSVYTKKQLYSVGQQRSGSRGVGLWSSRSWFYPRWCCLLLEFPWARNFSPHCYSRPNCIFRECEVALIVGASIWVPSWQIFMSIPTIKY